MRRSPLESTGINKTYTAGRVPPTLTERKASRTRARIGFSIRKKKYHIVAPIRKAQQAKVFWYFGDTRLTCTGPLAHRASSSTALSQIDDPEPLTEFFNATYYPLEFKRVFPPFRMRFQTHRRAWFCIRDREWLGVPNECALLTPYLLTVDDRLFSIGDSLENR
jgi:hypothetical protein